MAKMIKFPEAVPEKFGLQRAKKVTKEKPEKHGQLNLFTGGKVVRLNRLSSFEEGLLRDEQGDRDAAINLYLKAIEENDSRADAYCNLGILQFIKSEYPKAIDSFTNCLKLEPRHFEAHYNLANLYAEVGDLALAKFHYQVSIEVEPMFPNSYFNLGLTLAMSKEYAEAIRVLFQYRELVPEEDHKAVDDLILTLQRTLS
jgi:tetratricopeptide (TPR) repeat protein